MLLKMWILSGTAIALWLCPLVALDKRIGWHKSIQGLSLMAAVSCAIGAGNIARKQAEEDEIELIKTRAIKADVIDEISTSAYVSQTQRQQEAEAILAPPNAEMEEVRERLEALYKPEPSEPAEPLVQTLNQAEDNALAVDDERFTSLNLTKKQAIELIQKMRSELNQTQTIEKLWECKKGGSEAWKRAYAQFKSLMDE
ncbi:hypothetical protein QUA54_33330 [Microcoleus sp. MOSTC5]|uniref:hypothetical protein n=1 Tax=Microcoleus sp. MOSTC5 TaxID=3055378 RepID=UPI002FD6C27F